MSYLDVLSDRRVHVAVCTGNTWATSGGNTIHVRTNKLKIFRIIRNSELSTSVCLYVNVELKTEKGKEKDGSPEDRKRKGNR